MTDSLIFFLYSPHAIYSARQQQSSHRNKKKPEKVHIIIQEETTKIHDYTRAVEPPKSHETIYYMEGRAIVTTTKYRTPSRTRVVVGGQRKIPTLWAQLHNMAHTHTHMTCMWFRPIREKEKILRELCVCIFRDCVFALLSLRLHFSLRWKIKKVFFGGAH